MTSKEALSDLFFLAIGDEKHTKKCKETIEKDLEILRILKEYIKISDCKFEKAKRAGQCILMLIPDDIDDFKVIKEWLENEN